MNEMLKTIKELGLDKTAELLSEYINQKIFSEDIAIQFILEELESASQGNHHARQFVLNSGFDEDDYVDAMYNSYEEVDGKDGPQQEILKICMMLSPNQELMTELRIKTVDNIMKMWKLGKYSAIDTNLKLIDVVNKINKLNEGIFANINNDLNEAMSDECNIMIKMAYGYARRIVASALFLQGVFSYEDFEHANKIFNLLQLQTGQSVEFQEEAYMQAIELLESYDRRFNKTFMRTIFLAAKSGKYDNAYDRGLFLDDEKIFEMHYTT